MPRVDKFDLGCFLLQRKNIVQRRYNREHYVGEAHLNFGLEGGLVRRCALGEVVLDCGDRLHCTEVGHQERGLDENVVFEVCVGRVVDLGPQVCVLEELIEN